MGRYDLVQETACAGDDIKQVEVVSLGRLNERLDLLSKLVQEIDEQVRRLTNQIAEIKG